MEVKALLHPLHDYQAVGAKFALSASYLILGDEMGLGKSVQAIAVGESLAGNCLVVVPSYLVKNWYYEIKKFTGREATTFRTGKEVERGKITTKWTIIPYSLLGSGDGDGGVITRADHLFEKVEFVACDEATQIKSFLSQRTQAIHKMIYENSIPKVLLMTGTPILNRVGEIYSLLRVMSYNLNNSFSWFNEKYPTDIDFFEEFSYKRLVDVGRGRKVSTYYGIKNQNELHKLLKSRLIRRKAKDVLTLPDRQTINIVANYDNNASLQEAWEYFLENNDTINIKAKVESAKAKVDFTIEFAKQVFEERGPLLIYSDHVEPTTLIYEGLKDSIKCEMITGQTLMSCRDAIVERFKTGFTDIIVASIRSFNTGHTLIRAKTEIFNDLSWVVGDNDQAEGRIYRIGQEEKVVFYRVVGSIQDEKIIMTLDGKREVIQKSIG